jgi:hypothetical protein
MWISFPTTLPSSTSRPGPGCSRSASNSPSDPWDSGAELFVTSSGRQLPRPQSWHGWKRRAWVALLSGTTFAPSTATRGVESWTSSAAAIRASRSRSPVDAVGRMILATFGRPCVESLRSANQGSCSSRTSQGTLFSEPTGSSENWKSWATGLRRDCTRRLRSARVTSACACSSSEWPTPVTTDAHGTPCPADQQRNSPRLSSVAATWPTPTAGDHTGRPYQRDPRNPERTNESLVGAAQNWATPCAGDCEGNGGGQVSSLRKDVQNWSTPMAADAEQCKGGDGFQSLVKEARNWPTPTARDFRSGQRGPATTRTLLLNEAAEECPDGVDGATFRLTATPRSATTSAAGRRRSKPIRPSRRRLNPRFAEWLMGWCPGLTDCDLSEMELTQWRRDSLSCLCGLVSRTLAHVAPAATTREDGAC